MSEVNEFIVSDTTRLQALGGVDEMVDQVVGSCWAIHAKLATGDFSNKGEQLRAMVELGKRAQAALDADLSVRELNRLTRKNYKGVKNG